MINQEQDKVICVCGHTHYESMIAPTRNSFSILCFAPRQQDDRRYCTCSRYIPDNLGYLKNLYEQRTQTKA